jgi:RsiW-degrading membrane proteinase PrsW (M82 family)
VLCKKSIHLFSKKRYSKSSGRERKLKMEKVKYISMITAIFTQITGIIFLFINITIALGLFLVYFLSLLVLLVVFIKSRIVEEKEDDKNDYRDY